jgi:HTH-type transcriptional regulator / antitoxin HigA
MTMPNRTPAEVFPPGDFVREELDARGWTQSDLAEILGRPQKTISQIISGRKAVTPETARGLADAFGTSAELWMNLEAAYRLHRSIKDSDPDHSVSRRAKLFMKAPVKEMVKRHWVEPSDNVAVLEKRVCDFFGIRSVDQEPEFWEHAAKKSTSYEKVTPAQLAWLFRARQLARLIPAKPFSQSSLKDLLERLKLLLRGAEEVRQAPRLLAEHGIRLVVLEPLPQTRIDGVCFWLDKRSPAIALSLRYDRVDSFWHTLMHELGHVSNLDGLGSAEGALDVDLIGERAASAADLPEPERKANLFAADFLIHRDDLEDFIARTKPLYSKNRIRGFAGRIHVHPGIVVGQLQFRGEIEWSHSRDMLARVRDVVTNSALTDGWGHPAPRV